jgi:electron transport complex protein RnfE
MTDKATIDRAARDADLILVVALCPLIAANDTVVSALSLGIATVLVGLLSASVIALLKRWIDEDTQLVAVLLVTAGFVAIVELAMRAWFHVARETVGIFLPLIVCNLALMQRMRDASGTSGDMLRDIAKLTASVAVVLVVLGVAREIVGRGSLLYNAQALIGSVAGEISLFRVDMGFLLAMLPPGAFLSLGLLLALRNWLRGRHTVFE